MSESTIIQEGLDRAIERAVEKERREIISEIERMEADWQANNFTGTVGAAISIKRAIERRSKK